MDPARLHPSDPLKHAEFSRSHPTAARVLRRWRELTGGYENPQTRDTDRQTLIACSGGADSVALATILSLATPKPVIAHIIHDLRDPHQTVIDRDAACAVAELLGCEFVERSIQIRDLPGNTEHNARTARYTALTGLAIEQGITYIATGHHADDQLETMLMNIMRGTGPRGLGGIQESRELNGCVVIRPMLGITHQDAIEACELAGVEWVHDHTNDDPSLTRNRLRHQLLPAGRAFAPDIAERASTTADAVRSMVEAFDQMVVEYVWPAASVNPDSITWDRPSLQRQLVAVHMVLMRMCIMHLTGGVGLDQVTNQSLSDTIRAIKDSSTDPRSCRLGPIVVSVTAHQVHITRAPESCP